MSHLRIMQGATRLDLQPIEREELADNNVAYRNIKLLDKGVWTDENSRTPTLYNGETFENTEPESNGYDGPPVNIHHDLHPDGEPNEASVGGYIDPNSLNTDGDALFGDLILDLDENAGAFADDNLQSSLESNGEVGFSPSVELTPVEMDDADHPQAEEHVKAAKLTGLGLVRDPASKSVDFAHETRHREVAMSAVDSQNVKVLSRIDDDMSVIDTLREQHNLSEEIDEETVKELHEAGALTLEEDDKDEEEEEEEDVEAEEDDDEEEAEDDEMPMEEMMSELMDRVEQLEAEHEAMMSEEAVEQELGEIEQELSEAKDEFESVTKELAEAKETIEEQDKRLSEVEDTPVDPKTLADDGDTSEDWKEWASASGTPETSPNSMR